MLTLFHPVSVMVWRHWSWRDGRNMHVPVNTRPWESSTDSSGREAILLEVPDIPGFDARRAEKNSAVEFQGVVKFLRLDGSVATRGVEPVH